jgi:hypothetical protein
MGKVGDVIGTTATDDHAVQSVHVKIENSNGSLVEEGDAQQQAAPNQWQ